MVRVATLIVAILCIAPSAHAQNSSAPASPADLLHRAYELRLTGHDESALPLLEQAYAMDHSARVAAQLGLCDEAVGRWAEASGHLHEALAAPDDPWVARHLEALQSAYATVLSHFPRESSARPMTSRAPDDGSSGSVGNNGNSGHSGNTALTEGSIGGTPSSPSQLQPTTSGVAGNHIAPLGYAAVIAGGVFIIGGIAAWVARENIVNAFNGRGCRVGDPMPATGCDAAGAISGRNTTTALAAVGIGVGGVVEIIGATLLMLHRREESFPQRGFSQRLFSRGLTVGTGPGDIGVSVVGRF